MWVQLKEVFCISSKFVGKASSAKYVEMVAKKPISKELSVLKTIFAFKDNK